MYPYNGITRLESPQIKQSSYATDSSAGKSLRRELPTLFPSCQSEIPVYFLINIRSGKTSKHLLSIAPILSHVLRLLVPLTLIFQLEHAQSRQEFHLEYQVDSAFATLQRWTPCR